MKNARLPSTPKGSSPKTQLQNQYRTFAITAVGKLLCGVRETRHMSQKFFLDETHYPYERK